jgi:hypothetical protein
MTEFASARGESVHAAEKESIRQNWGVLRDKCSAHTEIK